MPHLAAAAGCLAGGNGAGVTPAPTLPGEGVTKPSGVLAASEKTDDGVTSPNERAATPPGA